MQNDNKVVENAAAGLAHACLYWWLAAVASFGVRLHGLGLSTIEAASSFTAWTTGQMRRFETLAITYMGAILEPAADPNAGATPVSLSDLQKHRARADAEGGPVGKEGCSPYGRDHGVHPRADAASIDSVSDISIFKTKLPRGQA